MPQTVFFDIAAVPIALFLAMLVNRVVAFFATPVFVKMGWDRQWLMYIAALIGLALAMLAEINLLPGIFPNPLVGRLVTAIITGGGANLIHDVIEALGGSGGTFLTGELSFEDVAVQTEALTITTAQPSPVAGTSLESKS